MGTLSYIKNFLKDRQVASITPTSRFTIERICRHIDFSKNLRVVEFGPADGVVTKVLLKNLSPESEIIAIETNRDFVRALEQLADDRLHVFNESAEQVKNIVSSRGWDYVDYVISGIPFSFLTKEMRRRILRDSAGLLVENGFFLGYQTSTHLMSFLDEQFSVVDTEMEYRNIPPMCVYIAGKQPT